MENQHRKIKGYRELSQEEIDLMNRIKAKGKELLELQAELAARLSEDHKTKSSLSDESGLNAKASNNPEVNELHHTHLQELRRFEDAQPHRWAAIGKTDIETGIMALVRAVAQPA